MKTLKKFSDFLVKTKHWEVSPELLGQPKVIFPELGSTKQRSEKSTPKIWKYKYCWTNSERLRPEKENFLDENKYFGAVPRV